MLLIQWESYTNHQSDMDRVAHNNNGNRTITNTDMTY